MRQHLFDNLGSGQLRRIVGRPVRDLFQERGPVVAPIKVVVVRLFRGDDVVAELDEARRSFVAGGLPEDEADAAITLLVGEDFVAIGLVVTAHRLPAAEECDLLSLNEDAVDVSLVPGLILGAIVLSALVAMLRLVGHDRIQRSVDKIRIDRLPVTFPIRQKA